MRATGKHTVVPQRKLDNESVIAPVKTYFLTPEELAAQSPAAAQERPTIFNFDRSRRVKRDT
ncbi:hypothetical protein EBB07_00040 [Paenibacillaceae bacterium]|nr:hypothetical protein EBB07_00040 [Paenibacillaceae bacterium]